MQRTVVSLRRRHKSVTINLQHGACSLSSVWWYRISKQPIPFVLNDWLTPNADEEEEEEKEEVEEEKEEEEGGRR